MKEEDGFIYQTAIDSSCISYGFRYIVLRGDLEITFQTGLLGTFSREEVERMYGTGITAMKYLRFKAAFRVFPPGKVLKLNLATKSTPRGTSLFKLFVHVRQPCG